MPTRALIVVIAALFALTVLARAPALWLTGALPAAIACQSPSGSLWHGQCDQLRFPGGSLQGVSWTMRAWPLLRGHADLELRSADARAPGTARVSLGIGGRFALQDLRADLPIDSGFLPLFPAGWSGQIQLAVDSVEFSAGRLVSIQGTVTARTLAQRNPPMPFGSFELRFAPVAAGAAPGGAPITGVLSDLGGPLAVSGTLTLRNDNEYELTGLAQARAEASDELAKAVSFLGPSDERGRRPFTLGGTF